MKFSIIIPVYNVEKYLDKCLNSVLKQTYSNYEVLIINDGSLDNSQVIIDQFVNRDGRFKSFIKENGGLSDARNYGIKYATGDYIIFLDSDDYVDVSYLEKLNEILQSNQNIDVLKIKLVVVDDFGNEIRKENGFNSSGYIGFEELVSLEFFEPAWSYIYRLEFWKNNKFEYLKGRVHEDFGLTPEILIKAKKIYYIDYYAYFYVQRKNSIMSSNSREKLLKKAYDMICQYDRLINLKLNDVSLRNIDIYRSFLANGLISKINTLQRKDRKGYIKELRKRNVVSNLLSDTFSRKLKKIVLKIKYRMW